MEFAAAPADVYSMQLQARDGLLNGDVEVVYGNTSEVPLDEVRFRLDMNLGKRSKMEVLSVKDGRKNDLTWQYSSLEFGKRKSEKAQICIRLPQPLAPGDSIELHFAFKLESTTAINSEMITLQDDPYYSLDAWYPKAMSLVDGSWSIDDHRPSEYRVRLELPVSYTLASTGEVLTDDSKGGRRKLELRAGNVRGFTIYASPKWRKHHIQKDRRSVTVFLPEESESWNRN